jgi:hypothetical protein
MVLRLFFFIAAIREKNPADPFLQVNKRKGGFCLILPALALFFMLIVISGCIQSQKTPAGMPASTEYAFIDHQTYADGRLINGSYPDIMIDVPTYRFDTAKGNLAGIVPFEINESLMIVYGKGTSISGSLGTGSSSILRGGYGLPCSFDALTIEGFTVDGSVHMKYNNETLVLEPGERWTDIRYVNETTSTYSMEKTVTETITYYGNLQKSGIYPTSFP